MKHVSRSIWMLSLAVILTISSAFAKPDNIRPDVTNAFYNRFGDIDNVTWTQKDQFNKASFMENGEQVNAFFRTDGTFIGKSKDYSIDKLNASVKEQLNKAYLLKGYTVSESIEFVNEDDVVFYFVKVVSDKNNVILQVTEGKYLSIFRG